MEYECQMIQMDRDKGRPRNSSRCAIARLIRRMLGKEAGFWDVHVGYSGVHVARNYRARKMGKVVREEDYSGLVRSFRLSEPAIDWLREFDRLKKAERDALPLISFTITSVTTKDWFPLQASQSIV